MNYNEALDYIHGTLKFGVKLGLDNIEKLLELMGNPHHTLEYVHVAGTNGKGSTVSFISRMLIEAGYKVGVYTSPYLERFTERIKVNDTEIPGDDLARITAWVKSKVEVMVKRGYNHPTEFEIVTAIAFQYYHENNCHIVVLEVGLGGRYDSTNIIDTPLVSVITSIGFDHMEQLGNTLAEIAFEKAGIIKDGGDVVVYPASKDIEAVFRKICDEKKATLHTVNFARLRRTHFGMDGQVFDYGEFSAFKISLFGEHQVKNAVVALNAIEVLRKKGYALAESAIRAGLEKAVWPGRLEVVQQQPLFLVDGAHNKEGVEVLADFLEEYFPDRKKVFIVGVLKDKPYIPMLEVIAPLADSFVAVTPPSERALPGEELAKQMKTYCKNVKVSDTIKNAVQETLKTCSEHQMICAFGSLYSIGEVKKWVANANAPERK